MTFSFANDWPALIVVALFLGFLAYLFINSRKNRGQANEKDAGRK